MELLVAGSDLGVPADLCREQMLDWNIAEAAHVKVALGDGALSQIWCARSTTVMERNKDISISAELSFWHHHKAPAVQRS